MILLVNPDDKRIYGYNAEKPKESLCEFENGVWYEGDFSLLMAEQKLRKRVEYYYDDGKIRIEYVDIPETSVFEATELETAQSKLDYLLMMKGSE